MVNFLNKNNSIKDYFYDKGVVKMNEETAEFVIDILGQELQKAINGQNIYVVNMLSNAIDFIERNTTF